MNTPKQRITVTLPNPLPAGVWCHRRDIYDGIPSEETDEVYITFLWPAPGDEDVTVVYGLEEIGDLFKAIDAGADHYEDVSEEWSIALNKPYKFLYNL